MIARTWSGAVRTEKADAYAEYVQATGIAAYTSTPGNHGAWMLRREVGELTEFLVLSLWDSLESIKAFAGEDYETAVFYPEDDDFLVTRDLKTHHYAVAAHTAPNGRE